jgi:hypothetical protein
MNLIGGGVAGIVGTSVMFPVDMVKTRLQNQKAGKKGEERMKRGEKKRMKKRRGMWSKKEGN